MWIRRLRSEYLSPSYRNIDLQFHPINIFLGANNSGKTRILLTLFHLADKQFDPESRVDINEYIRNHEEEYDNKFLPSSSKIAPFRYLSVDRNPPVSIDTRNIGEIYNALRHKKPSQGVNDFLAELHEIPLLRPRIQFEIEQLFGISISFEYSGFTFTLFADENNPSQRIPFNQLGKGIQLYISLFFYLYHPTVRVIFVDEPENSLHPQLQRALIHRIRKTAFEQGKQIFIASHSPIMALPEKTEELNGVFLLQRYSNPSNILPFSIFIPIDPCKRKRFDSFFPNLDISIAELFFAKGVLIVEGQTDRQFVKYIASRLKQKTTINEITVIESNGLGLMSGLIDITKRVTSCWRSLCDGDLLEKRGARYTDYRRDISSIIELEIIPDNIDQCKSKRTEFSDKGVDILEKSEIENYYCSPSAIEYLRQNKRVEPKDKGWLLEEELEFLNGKGEEFIRENYQEIIATIDKLIIDVESNSNKPKTIRQILSDIMFNDANIIHNDVYHQQMDESTLREYLSRARNYDTYDLKYESYKKYELYWNEEENGLYRIRCEDKLFIVEMLSDKKEFIELRKGTIFAD